MVCRPSRTWLTGPVIANSPHKKPLFRPFLSFWSILVLYNPNVLFCNLCTVSILRVGIFFMWAFSTTFFAAFNRFNPYGPNSYPTVFCLEGHRVAMRYPVDLFSCLVECDCFHLFRFLSGQSWPYPTHLYAEYSICRVRSSRTFFMIMEAYFCSRRGCQLAGSGYVLQLDPRCVG